MEWRPNERGIGGRRGKEGRTEERKKEQREAGGDGSPGGREEGGGGGSRRPSCPWRAERVISPPQPHRTSRSGSSRAALQVPTADAGECTTAAAACQVTRDVNVGGKSEIM